MRSSIVAPAGVVWSKKRAATMCSAWRSAARRRRGFSRSAGSPWRARSALWRHSTAARTTSTLARVGRRLVLAQAWACAGVAIAAKAVSETARRRALRTAMVGNTADDLPGTSWIDAVVRRPGREQHPSATRLAHPCVFRELRGFASRPRGRFAVSGANLKSLSGYVALTLSVLRHRQTGLAWGPQEALPRSG